MAEPKLLDVEELRERWGYKITSNTLQMWRSKGIGPKYIRLKKVMYPLHEVEKYERDKGMVPNV